MIYLDTDFIIHYLVVQNKERNRIAVKNFKKLKENNKVFISLLTLQEISFVLAKLKMPTFQINENLDSLKKISSINYNLQHFERASILATKLGFENINDCLHTAIAESYCKELYTFNKSDFEKIKNQTTLSIRFF